MTAKLTLYVDDRFATPYGMAVFVALTEKKLPFELIALDLEAGEQHTSAFAKQSTTQRVPTLVRGDFCVSESTAIIEYLDEVFPSTPMLPLSTQNRAIARQVQAWIRSDLFALRAERSTETIFYAPINAPLSEAAQAARDKLFAAATALLTRSTGHLFEHWCIADVDLALMLKRLVANGDAVPDNLLAYANRQWARESVQAWLNLPRPSL